MLWLAWHFWLYGAAGFRDETLSAYLAPGQAYHLAELNGEAATARVTLRVPSPWHLEMQTPCVRYHWKLMVPYPWFEIAALRAVDQWCPDGPLDRALIATLERATLAEALGPVLTLSTDEAELMVFRVQP